MFSEIAEIKSIREQKSKLSEREKELTEPILTDLDMIGMLYRWFQEIISQKEIFRSGNVTQRKKFIFIILFLYSPSTLAGGKMKNGLRDKLAEVLGVNAQTTISNNRNNLVFSYQLYKYFRQDVDWIYGEMMERIKPENHYKYVHPDFDYFIPVGRHPAKEIPNGTLDSMMKKAGLKK